MPSISSDVEIFLGQAPIFADSVRRRYLGDDLPDPTTGASYEIPAIEISNYEAISDSEAKAIVSQYYSRWGVTRFIVRNDSPSTRREHPLLRIASQLSRFIGCLHPMRHALETHIDASANVGPEDGTVKIYAATGKGAARSSGDLLAHQDGLGCCGDVNCVGLYLESPARCGGRTYFINLALLCTHLNKIDPLAFEALFLPDAVNVFRSSGYRSLRITAPVCSLYEDGTPQVFFRRPGGEYLVSWKEGNAALERAREYLEYYTRPFASGSAFIGFREPGEGCLNDNHLTIHGREAFEDGPFPDQRRILSRKWFSPTRAASAFKHAPGFRLAPEFAALFPALSGPDALSGEWFYDAVSNENKMRDRNGT